MATSRKGLGRGLSGLIAGGATTSSVAPLKKNAPKKHKKELREPPAARPKDKKKTKAKTPGTEVPVTSVEGFQEIALKAIDPSPYQMRRDFDETALAELAESIRSEGLLQPVTVRVKGERFELIAGERRFRACQRLQLKTITAHVVKVADASAAVMALIENLQREDLNPIDEALGFASLMQDFNLTQEEVAERVGKGRASIANHLRLLRLNKECQGYVRSGRLSFGHARALLGLDSQEQQTLLARQAVEEGLSVREVEALVNRFKSGGGSTRSPFRKGGGISESEQAVVRDLEQRLASHFNTKVQLRHAPKKGVLSIEYYGNEDLQRILEKFGLEA